MRVLKTLFKPLALSIVAMAIFALGQVVAEADPVTFSTSGTFTCAGCLGNNTNSVVFLGGPGNALMITFNGLGSTSLNTPTGSSFGDFEIDVSGNGASGVSGTFTLTITQTVPTGGTGDFSATFSGTFSATNSGTGVVSFSVTSVVIGDVTYSITNNPLNLVPPASNNGITTVQGFVDIRGRQGGEVPEPASMLLLGTGLIGVAGAARRRFQKRA